MLSGKGQLMRGCEAAWEAACSWHWWAAVCLPGGGSQLDETWVLVLQEEPGAWSHGMVQGSEHLEPCRLACPLPDDPWGAAALLFWASVSVVLSSWHGLVHQVQTHLVQVLVPPEMAGSAGSVSS